MNKFGKNQQNNSSESPENLGSKRIYVGGLTDHLAELKEQDIKEVRIVNKFLISNKI